MFDPKGARILIAEDDPSLRLLLTTRLELAGYRTICANNGKLAVEIVNASQPDAIVLDINMPGLDGFGVLTALKSRPRDSQPPVLVLTARNGEEDVRRCLALGAKDFLAKPFKDALFLARVARLLRRIG